LTASEEKKSLGGGIKLKLKFNPSESPEAFDRGRLSTRNSRSHSKASHGTVQKPALKEAGSPSRLIGTPVRFTSPEVTDEFCFEKSEGIVQPTSSPVAFVSVSPVVPVTLPTEKTEQSQARIQESAPFGTAPAAEVALVHQIVGIGSASAQEKKTKRRKKSKKKTGISTSGSSNMSATQTPASSTQNIQRTLSSQPRFQTYDSIQTIPPHLFDLVPSAERLLSRILVPDQGIGAAAILDYENSVPEHKRPLDIKDLDAAANSIMVQIQRAKTAVMGLQGVDRTVEEQEEEIKWLEEKIEKQRGMMGKLKEMMEQREDTEMKE
jgi:hypothetical protein